MNAAIILIALFLIRLVIPFGLLLLIGALAERHSRLSTW